MESQRKPGPGPQAQADLNRQVRLWSLRLQLYCRMKENFLKTGQWFSVRLWFCLKLQLMKQAGSLCCCFFVLFVRKTLHQYWTDSDPDQKS